MKWLVVFSLVAAASAGTIPQKSIPVRVVYSHPDVKFLDARNLEPKNQLSVEEEIFGKPKEEKVVGNVNAVRNLDEKLQLSQEELEQIGKQKIVVPEEDLHKTQKPDVSGNQGEDWHSELIIQQAQEIVTSGLAKLKKNLETDMVQKDAEIDDLDKKIQEHLTDLRQSAGNNTQQNIIQQIVSGVSNFAQNIIQQNNNINPLNNNNNGTNQGDEQRPPNQFIATFVAGLGNITSTIQNLAGQNNNNSATVLGDNQNPSAPNFFQTIGQTIANINPFNQQQPSTSQGDNPQPVQPAGIFQTIQSSFNNILPFNPLNNSGQADAGNQSAGNPLQSIASSITQTISGIIRQNGTNQENGGGGGGIFQNVQNQIQQFASSANVPTTSQPAAEGTSDSKSPDGTQPDDESKPDDQPKPDDQLEPKPELQSKPDDSSATEVKEPEESPAKVEEIMTAEE